MKCKKSETSEKIREDRSRSGKIEVDRRKSQIRS